MRVQGATDNADGSTALRFGAGYVDKIKPRNAEDFESMATAAGAPSGVDRGVYVAGANFKSGQFSLGAIEYYSEDIIHITYTEFKYAVPLASRVTLRFGAQYTDQHSAGEDLLTGKTFHADQSGFKAELGYGPTLFTVARTLTAVGATSSNGSGTDMRNPWGGYPGYTAVQIENFYRAGEDATLLRAAYNFPRVTGLSVYALYVDGSTPNVANQYAQREYDMNLQWVAKDPHSQGADASRCATGTSRSPDPRISTRTSCGWSPTISGADGADRRGRPRGRKPRIGALRGARINDRLAVGSMACRTGPTRHINSN